MALVKKEFLKRYSLSDKQLAELKIEWDDLVAIHDDHLAKAAENRSAGSLIVDRLSGGTSVHSLKFRVKDAEHLLEKVIRKRVENPDRVITVENYRTEITDLVGIRVLHLFKAGWRNIHDLILDIWHGPEAPVAYVRKGDDTAIFEDAGCEAKIHPRGYRSVHYIVTCQPTKLVTLAEIQVRTIFEEGWSEIDHSVAYPNSVDDAILVQYLSIFNVLAGAADQMASFITQLRDALKQERQQYTDQEKELKNTISRLEKLETDLKLERGEKEKLQNIVSDLKRHQDTLVRSSGVYIGSPIDVGAISGGLGAAYRAQATNPIIGGTFGTASLCPKCGERVPISAKILSEGQYKCPCCGQATVL